MNDREKAIEKVRKLLALAERPGTSGEGEAACARADAIMARHGLTPADITPPAAPSAKPSAWPASYGFAFSMNGTTAWAGGNTTTFSVTFT